jgi:hypothetical protein
MLPEKEYDKFYISNEENDHVPLFLQQADAQNYNNGKRTTSLRKVFLQRPKTHKDIRNSVWSMFIIGWPGDIMKSYIGQAKYDDDGQQWIYLLTNKPYHVWTAFIDS